jgi:hypothetical protein
MYLWDELDDLVWAVRHVLRKAWHGLRDREPRVPEPAPAAGDLVRLAD